MAPYLTPPSAGSCIWLSQRLEPCAGKLACTVLRRAAAGDSRCLSDPLVSSLTKLLLRSRRYGFRASYSHNLTFLWVSLQRVPLLWRQHVAQQQELFLNRCNRYVAMAEVGVSGLDVVHQQKSGDGIYSDILIYRHDVIVKVLL